MNQLPSMGGGLSSSTSQDEETQSEEDGKEDGKPIAYNGLKPVVEAKDSAEVSGNGLLPSLQSTRVADKLKGQAVSRQIVCFYICTCMRISLTHLFLQRIWDSLVDARIRLQKTVTSANKLPHVRNGNNVCFLLILNQNGI